MKRKIGKIKEEIKGITLVALVVTIIVLLILAGVAISLSIGEDGIFKRAKEGAETYQNASENEKVELDKVSNYINNYLKENNKEDEEEEEEIVLDVEEAIKSGTIYKENTVIYDKYSNPVKVPKGFKLAQDSGTDVTKGIVIEDANAGDEISKGNQYVWVPLGNIKYNENGDVKTINLGRYSFDATYNEETGQIEGTGEDTIQQLADDYENIVTIDTYFKELENSEHGNIVAKNLIEFITKTKASGGYYIGRFEAGKIEGNTNTFSIKKGQEVYNEISEPNAANLSRNLYSSNSNFESDLINSYAWDTAVVFIQTFSGDADYSKQSRLQDELTTTGNANDNNNYDVRCNIYDMAGNVREWTTETCEHSQNIPCTTRGGYYYSSQRCTASRNAYDMSSSFPRIGFRPILYL